MKKIALLFFILFAFVIANAKITKEVYRSPYPVDFIHPCTGEHVTGVLTLTETYWYNPNGTIKRFQAKIKGEASSDEGAVYTVSYIQNDMAWKWYYEMYYDIETMGANPNTFVEHVTWERDGVPILVNRLVWHWTMKPNGETAVDIVHSDFQCL